MIPYYEEVIEVIKDSIASISVKKYEQLLNECVETLKIGGKIIASGLGKNVPICEKFVGTLNSLGIDARFLHTNSAIHGDLGLVNRQDIVLLLSKGGSTYETVALAGYLKARETNTWLISFEEKCKAAEFVDKQLTMKLVHEGDEWNIVPNNSTTVYLILLQGIAIEVGKRMGVVLDDFKRNHPGGGIGAKLNGKNLW